MAFDEHFAHLSRNATLTPADELEPRLAEGRPLRVKLGIDPTGADLHLGHLVILQKLREWQLAGHVAVVIVGDATARVGDPSGRTKSRPPMSEEEIEANTVSLMAGVGRVLDVEHGFELHRNSEWLNMPSFDLFRLLQRTTLAQLLEREDVRARHRDGDPVSMLELLYPLLQGFDSVAVSADVELGGRDQLINLMMGRELQRDAGGRPQTAMMMDLLVGLDGVEKMSKSAGNHVALDGNPIDGFGRIMSLPDAAMDEWFSLLGVEDPSGSPRDRKWALAEALVGRLSGPAAAEAAAADFHRRFVERGRPDEASMPLVDVGGERAVPVVLEQAFGISRGEARRLIKSGSVRVDGVRVDDLERDGLAGSTIQIGQKRWARLR